MARFGASGFGRIDDYYVFDQAINCFYHFFLKQDWKIAEVPIDTLETFANETMAKCNLILAVFPHFPNDEQKTNMTSVIQVAQEMVADPPKYQFEVFFDLQFSNNTALGCTKDTMTAKVADFLSDQGNSGTQALFIGLGIAVAIGLVCVGAFFAYQQWNKGQPSSSVNSMSSLLHNMYRADRTNAAINESTQEEYDFLL